MRTINTYYFVTQCSRTCSLESGTHIQLPSATWLLSVSAAFSEGLTSLHGQWVITIPTSNHPIFPVQSKDTMKVSLIVPPEILAFTLIGPAWVMCLSLDQLLWLGLRSQAGEGGIASQGNRTSQTIVLF